MKCESTKTFLIFLLGVAILLDVLFAVQTINRTREFRTLQYQILQENATFQQFQQIESMARDAAAYNQKNPSPELTKILQGSQVKSTSK